MKHSILTLLLIVVAAGVSAQEPDSAYLMPAHQSFYVWEGVNQALEGTISVYSAPDGVPYTVSLLYDNGLVHLHQTSGVTNDTITFEVRVDAAMVTGWYDEYLVFEVEGYDDTLYSQVKLGILVTPYLDSVYVSPVLQGFRVPEGVTHTLEGTVSICSTPRGLPYTVSLLYDNGLVQLDQTSGVTNDAIAFEVYADSGMAPGYHTEYLMFEVEGCEKTPYTQVRLYVIDTPYGDSAWVDPKYLFYEHEPVPESATTPVCLIDTVLLGSLNAPAAYDYYILGGAESFVSVSGTSGFTNDLLEISLCLNGLEPGWHDDTVVFSIEGVSQQPRLAVSLLVEEQDDSAWVAPESLSFEFFQNASKQQKAYVSIFSSNAPAHYSCYPLAGPTSFVSIPDSSGYTNDSVLLVIDPSGLEPGFHETAVEFCVDGCDEYPLVNILVEIAHQPVPDSGHHGVHNQPNPFNPSTTIYFTLNRSENVELAVYDILGRKVAGLHSGRLPAGDHQIVWGGTNDAGQKVSSGVYLCRLIHGDNIETNKMVLMK